MEFVLVYIREAHAIDGGWAMGRLEVEDPISDKERTKVASTCVAKLKLPMPAVVDKIDDRVNLAYRGHPDRLYLVGKDGKIAYVGGRGPRGFRPDELEDAILDELDRLAGRKTKKRVQQDEESDGDPDRGRRNRRQGRGEDGGDDDDGRRRRR